MSDINYPVHGKCQCGQVTYEISKEPMYLAVCHCKECQKLSASAFSMTMILSSDAIKFSGDIKVWERPSESGNINRAHFCPTCGNRIYHTNPARPEVIRLKPGTLEQAALLKPQGHFWVSEKQQWVEIPEGVQQFETQPEM